LNKEVGCGLEHRIQLYSSKKKREEKNRKKRKLGLKGKPSQLGLKKSGLPIFGVTKKNFSVKE